jgi:hypothetical protein
VRTINIAQTMENSKEKDNTFKRHYQIISRNVYACSFY